MKDDTDVKARFEFNMGLDDNDVWIDNVKLIKTEDAPVIDPSEIARPPLLSATIYTTVPLTKVRTEWDSGILLWIALQRLHTILEAMLMSAGLKQE